MDFVHFLKSQRYRSRVPLRQLQFTVAVYRAIIVEETNVELLTEITVPWDGKVFSPLETLDLYKDLTALTQRPTNAAGELRVLATATAGVPTPTVPATRDLGTNAFAPTEGGTAVLNTSNNLPPNLLALPTPHGLIAQLRQPSSRFFTRPSLEDFIDRAEEDFPVDPPQGPSLLAPIILRQHRRDHQPHRKMFLMWASGDVVVPEYATSPPAPAVGAKVVNGAAPNVSMEAAGDAFSPIANLPELEVGAIMWKGNERVICTLTAEPDEYVFTARPSLNEVHTLFVDAAYIYTFRVEVSKVEAVVAPTGPAIGKSVKGALDTSASPLDVVLANVRELAQYAEDQYEQLEISRDAVARRLLRQAALMVPPERCTSGPAGTAAALTGGGAATAGSPDDGISGWPRHASLGLGTTNGRLGASVSAMQRAAGVGGVLLSRSSVMRGGNALPRGMCQYYIFGTVERCVGIAESTLFLRCQLVEDDAAPTWLYDPLATSSPSAVCEFSSQLAYISSFVEDECVLDVDHVFNLPFDYNFVGAVLPSSPLRLIVSALTEGAAAVGIQSAVAYACVSLPITSPGRHTITAAMWAPHKSGVEFLRSALIGGAPSLVDARQAGPPPGHRTGISVKEGLYADSVGRVHVTVNIVHNKNHDGY